MTKLAMSEYAIVSAIGIKISATNPSMKNIGRNTAAVVMVEAVIAPATSFAPNIAASTLDFPSASNR